MTREEAIDIIKCLAWHTRPNEEDIEQAIETLKQEPCDDCVNRKAVNALVEELRRNIYDERSCMSRDAGMILSDFYDLPSVLPEREQGKWIEVHPLQEDDGGAYMCSKCRCGHPYIAPHWKFCPNCGAEMR